MCENWFILFICDANAKNLKLHCGTWKNRKTGRNWQQMTSCGFDCGLVCWLLNVGLGTVLDWDTTLHNMGHCDNWTFWDATFPSNGKVWIKLGNTYPFIMFFNFLPWRFDTVRWGRVLAKYDLIDFPFLFFFWANWSQLMGNMNINIHMVNTIGYQIYVRNWTIAKCLFLLNLESLALFVTYICSYLFWVSKIV